MITLKSINGLFKQLSSKIKKNEANNELIKHSVYAFFIRLLAAASVFIMNMVATRYLGIYQSGIFFLALTVVTIGSTVVRMGFDNVILRYSGIFSAEKNWGSLAYVISKTIWPATILSVTVTAFIAIFSNFISVQLFHKPELTSTLMWMSFAIPAVGIATLFAMGFQGNKNVLLSVSIQNVFIPIGCILLIFIVSPKTSGSISILYFATSVFTLVFSLIMWKIKIPSSAALPVERVNVWKQGMPMWIVATMQLATQWAGQFIAGIYTKPEELARLAVAQRVSLLVTFILTAVNLVSAPRFASFYRQGKMKELRKYTKNAGRLMFAFATPLIVIIWIFPTYIMSLFGKGFSDGAWMLRILALGQFINVISGSVGYLLSMSGHVKDMRNITLLSGAIAIVFNIVLISKFGALGASIAIALSIATQNLVAVRMVNKRLGFNTIKFW